jgi:DNA repair protein RecO (recombination protein O)
MLVTVDALVIARREFGDTSCFVDVLTKEYGVIEVVAKGVKKLNSPFAAATTLFSYNTFCLNKNNSKLRYTLNSAKCNLTFHALAEDLQKLALAAYFSELVKFTATPEEESGDLLRSLLIALYELCRTPPRYEQPQIKAKFECKLAEELGFGVLSDNPEKDLLLLLEQKSFKTLKYYKSLCP